MLRYFSRLLLCGLLVLPNLSCSVNVLTNFADKNTNEAYYLDAVDLLNGGYYSAALDKVNLMSGDYPTMRKVLRLKADIYGGMCGINFLSFIQSFGSFTGNLITFLMSTYRAGTLTNADACEDAEDILESIGTASARTSDENVRMLVLGFSKVGSILGNYADSNNDGTPDAAWNSCSNTDLPDAYARQVGTGITRAMASLTAIAGSVNLGGSSLTTLSSICSSLPAGYQFCAVTNPATFTANEVKGIRTLLKEDSVIGLGADCDGDITTCNCP